jgi:hypothetical protein
MEWYEQLGIQVGVAFAKEGFNFIFSKLKSKDAKKEPSELPDPEEAASNAEEEAEIEAEKALESESGPGEIDWTKTATLFWLGNDLMWIKDQMFRGSSPARVLQGVEHALKYTEALGFGSGSLPQTNLKLAQTILEALPPSGDLQSHIRVIQQHYRTVVGYIDQTKFYISAKAEGNEPGFVKLRSI